MKKLSLQLRMIRGSLGKQFVIKHYKYGIVRTKFPDMSGIVATAQQRTCRNLFAEAVAYAKSVIRDPQKKTEWQKRLRRPNGVYNAAITFYMQREKQEQMRNRMTAQLLIHRAVRNGEAKEVDETVTMTSPVFNHHQKQSNEKEKKRKHVSDSCDVSSEIVTGSQNF